MPGSSFALIYDDVMQRELCLTININILIYSDL
jgi:hypothetical protein